MFPVTEKCQDLITPRDKSQREVIPNATVSGAEIKKSLDLIGRGILVLIFIDILLTEKIFLVV